MGVCDSFDVWTVVKTALRLGMIISHLIIMIWKWSLKHTNISEKKELLFITSLVLVKFSGGSSSANHLTSTFFNHGITPENSCEKMFSGAKILTAGCLLRSSKATSVLSRPPTPCIGTVNLAPSFSKQDTIWSGFLIAIAQPGNICVAQPVTVTCMMPLCGCLDPWE